MTDEAENEQNSGKHNQWDSTAVSSEIITQNNYPHKLCVKK